MERTIGERQRWAWLAAGYSAVAATGTGGYGWIWVLLGGLFTAVYDLVMDRSLREQSLASILRRNFGWSRNILAGLILLWTILVMGWTANLADQAFSQVDGFPGLGWVLLALAAWGCRKGAAACARCSGVLCLILIALYGVIVVFAAPDVRVAYLVPTADWDQGIWTVGLLLLPAGVWYIPCNHRPKGPAWPMACVLPLFAAALAAVTVGVLSPELAASREVPLYDLAQSVSLFGVVERIEPLLSAAMTMGIFALLSIMACSAQALADVIRPWLWNGVGSCVLAGAAMFLAKDFPAELIAIGAVVFCMLIPLLLVTLSEKRD